MGRSVVGRQLLVWDEMPAWYNLLVPVVVCAPGSRLVPRAVGPAS